MALAYTKGWLEHVGHRRFTAQCDGEPAIQEFVRLATVSVGDNVRVQKRIAPVNSHGSQGSVERCIQTLAGLIRASKFELEALVKGRLPCRQGVVTFMPAYAAW